MNNLINVNPEQLDQTANQIESSDGEYQRLFTNLYLEVDKLSSSWSGKDNQAFTTKIKSYEDDFRQISAIMRQYADFLRASARAYRETQEEMANAASRLKE